MPDSDQAQHDGSSSNDPDSLENDPFGRFVDTLFPDENNPEAAQTSIQDSKEPLEAPSAIDSESDFLTDEEGLAFLPPEAAPVFHEGLTTKIPGDDIHLYVAEYNHQNTAHRVYVTAYINTSGQKIVEIAEPENTELGGATGGSVGHMMRDYSPTSVEPLTLHNTILNVEKAPLAEGETALPISHRSAAEHQPRFLKDLISLHDENEGVYSLNFHDENGEKHTLYVCWAIDAETGEHRIVPVYGLNEKISDLSLKQVERLVAYGTISETEHPIPVMPDDALLEKVGLKANTPYMASFPDGKEYLCEYTMQDDGQYAVSFYRHGNRAPSHFMRSDNTVILPHDIEKKSHEFGLHAANFMCLCDHEEVQIHKTPEHPPPAINAGAMLCGIGITLLATLKDGAMGMGRKLAAIAGIGVTLFAGYTAIQSGAEYNEDKQRKPDGDAPTNPGSLEKLQTLTENLLTGINVTRTER